MKNLALVPFALLLVLAAGFSLAAASPQAEPAVSPQEPAAATEVREPLPDLVQPDAEPPALQLEEPVLLDNPPCSATMICETCPNGDARLCQVMVCGSQKTKSCGQCVPNCTTEF